MQNETEAENMEKKNIKIWAVIVPVLLLAACSDAPLSDNRINESEVRFSIGFAHRTSPRLVTDDSFKTVFEPGDAIGIFAYKRQADQESSIETNEPHFNNVKAVFDEGQWLLESPLYYTNDGTVLDIYAYYPYREGADATAIEYDASANMTDLLSASATGIGKSAGQPVPLLFEHLLAMIHLTIEQGEIEFGMDATFNAYFYGTVACTYHLATKAIDKPSTGVAAMALFGEADTQERDYRVWIPAQTLEAAETVFAFSQITQWEEFSLTGEIDEPVELLPGRVYLHHQFLKGHISKDVQYKLYEAYPKYGTPVGMVVETFFDGRCGKVIYLKNGSAPWATSYGNTGSTDHNDGISNMMKIQTLPDWETSYPAFAACRTRNEGWYLPTRNESFDHLYTNVALLNEMLKKIQGHELIDTEGVYWTSTEEDANSAWVIDVGTGDSRAADKTMEYLIRAFYEF